MHSFAALAHVRHNLRILDQEFVYVLIAGTYTPLCLVAMRGDWGWVVFPGLRNAPRVTADRHPLGKEYWAAAAIHWPLTSCGGFC